jgi:acetylornithine deacetylase/succinyl-diaminopimelate desuccinylase-like protein
MDAEGNVMGIRRGTGAGPLIAIAAHLDTVFPEGTDVKVKRQGARLFAPGIGDNSRGLAVMLGIIRALDAAHIQTRSDILFVGNVGEEGPGDLRGVRYLFQKGSYKDRIRMFVSIDGAGDGSDIVTTAIASRRYRVAFRGPGGHSYGGFGMVNPAYALARAVDKLARMSVPGSPRTTYNVGLIGGGTSVNSIPSEVWMEVDLRSESASELEKLSDNFLKQARNAVDEENIARSTALGRVELDVQSIGERPFGQTRVDTPIVQTASVVAQRFGLQPRYSSGSTDANIPMSMRIPSITVDSGGIGGRVHTLDEWIDVEKNSSVKGIQLLLTTVVALAGLP